MPVTAITPGYVTERGLDADQPDIDIAAHAIHQQTGYTLDEHVDQRSIPDTVVREAWTIVAHRNKLSTRDDDAQTLTSETQGDYSTATTLSQGRYEYLVAGKPWELLMGNTTWHRSTEFKDVEGFRWYDDFGAPMV